MMAQVRDDQRQITQIACSNTASSTPPKQSSRSSTEARIYPFKRVTRFMPPPAHERDLPNAAACFLKVSRACNQLSTYPVPMHRFIHSHLMRAESKMRAHSSTWGFVEICIFET
jgi:hypothetical protein